MNAEPAFRRGEFSGSDGFLVFGGASFLAQMGFLVFRRAEWLKGDDALDEKRATKIAGKTSGFHKNPIF